MRKPAKPPTRRRRVAAPPQSAPPAPRGVGLAAFAAAACIGVVVAAFVMASAEGSWQERVRAAYQQLESSDSESDEPLAKPTPRKQVAVNDLAYAMQAAAFAGDRLEIARLVRRSEAAHSRNYSLELIHALHRQALETPENAAAAGFAVEVLLTELVRLGRVVRPVVDAAEEVFRLAPDRDLEHERASAVAAELIERRRRLNDVWTLDSARRESVATQAAVEASDAAARAAVVGEWGAAAPPPSPTESVRQGSLVWGGGSQNRVTAPENPMRPAPFEEPRPGTSAAAPIETAPEADATAAPEIQLLKLLHEPAERWQAFETLRERGWSESAIEVGRRAVSDDWRVRRQLVEVLPQIDDVDANSWLLLLSRDESPEVRRRVVALLAASNSSDLRRRLAVLASDDPDREVRELAARVADGPLIR